MAEDADSCNLRFKMGGEILLKESIHFKVFAISVKQVRESMKKEDMLIVLTVQKEEVVL